MSVLEMVLASLLIFQQIYWSRLANKLIDKLMSRNYHEYSQANQKPEPRRAVVNDAPIEDLNSLNDFSLV